LLRGHHTRESDNVRHLALLCRAAYAKSMFDSQLQRAFSPLIDGLAAPLARRGASAMTVTVAGFVCGIAAIVFIISGFYGIGFLLLLLNRICDGVDGAVARRTEPTALGEFLDVLLDYVVIAAVPFAFAASQQTNALAAAFLLLGLMAWATSELGFKLMQAHYERDYPLEGRRFPTSLCGFTETFVVFALMCFAPWLFSVLCYLYGILLFVSVGVRVAGAIMSADNTAP
jgi:phosphatidylglycerophosphate synthase